MTDLDINTTRGQETLADELVAIGMFEAEYPNSTYIKTAKDDCAIIDGLIERSGTIIGIAETKCRYNLSLDDFARKFGSQWLVTFDKIEGGRRLADALIVPFWGFLYLVTDRVLLIKKLYDPKAGWLTSFEVRKSETQATCNGGKASRDNAYINMRSATAIRSPA